MDEIDDDHTIVTVGLQWRTYLPFFIYPTRALVFALVVSFRKALVLEQIYIRLALEGEK
jgi:hypothetical protein